MLGVLCVLHQSKKFSEGSARRALLNGALTLCDLRQPPARDHEAAVIQRRELSRSRIVPKTSFAAVHSRRHPSRRPHGVRCRLRVRRAVLLG